MQNVDQAQDALSTEAKLTDGDLPTRETPTIEVHGTLDVRDAEDVYLNLQASAVASIAREGLDLILVDAEGEVLRLQGFFEGGVQRKLFLEDDSDREVLVDTAPALADGPLALSLTPTSQLSPFESLTALHGGTVAAGTGAGLGLIALGGLAAAGGLAAMAGGDSGSSSAAPPAPAPDTTPPAAPRLSFNAAGSVVSGSGEAGTTVTVRNSGGAVIGTGTVGADGQFSVTVSPPLTNGQGVTATLTDAAGNISQPGTATAPDLTPPAQPANVAVTGAGTTVTGSGEAGATVTVRGPGGGVIGTGTVGADGSFTVTLTTPQTNGQTVSVVLTDAAGNASNPGTATAPDTTAPSQPTNVAVAGAGTTVTGSGEAGATVTVRGPGGGVIGTGTVGADGTFTVTLTTPQTNGQTVSVVLTDAAGNASNPGTATAPDTTAPSQPTNVAVAGAGTTVTGSGEAGATVTVRGPGGGVIGTGTVAADGTFTVTLTTPQTNGQTVSVVLTDAAGNASSPGTATAADTTPPAAVTDVAVSPNGGSVTGQGEIGATVTVRGPDGSVIGTGQVQADGRFTVALTSPQIASETLSVVQADQAGNVSPVVTTLAPDLTVPGGPNGSDAPILIIGEAAGGVNAVELSDGVQARVVLTPGAQAGDRVVLTVSAGATVFTVDHVLVASEVASGGAQIVLPATLADATYTVVATIDDGRGGVSASSNVVTLVIDTTTPVPVIQSANGAGLSGTAEAGATIVLLTSGGAPVVGANGAPVTATVAADGTWSVPASSVPGGLNGFTGAVRATDPAGNTAQAGVGPVDGTTPAPVITAQNGLGVQGLAEAGATLTLLDASGRPVTGANGAPVTATADADGRWSIPASLVPGGVNGFTGSVQAVDAVGNTATSPVGPIDGTVTLSLNIDPVTGDNVINIAEAGSASVTVTGAALGDFTAGETVTVTLSNGATRTAQLTASGTWSVAFAGSDLAASTSVTVVSTATDAAGNSVTIRDTQAYGLDLTPPPAPLVTTANGAGVSGTAEVGSTIALLGAGGAVVATVAVGADGRWSVPAGAVPGGLNGFTGSVRASDAAGNTAATAVGPIDGVTSAPVVTSANGAGLTGTAEAGATVTLTTAAGEPVLGAGGQPVTAVVGANGVWTLPASAIPGGLDGFTGTVRATDPAGNTATEPVGPVDGVSLTPVIVAANGAGLFGTAEAGATVSLLGASGAPVLDGSGAAIRVQVGADGSWTIPASTIPGGIDGFTGSVVSVDAAGNSATAPVGPVDGQAFLTLTIDDVTADNVLNAAEAAQAAVVVTGRAIGDLAPGATIRVELSTGVFQTAVLGADRTWSVIFSGAQLQASSGITATATGVDAAGNAVTATDAHVYGQDLVTQIPVVTLANQAGLSGTAEAGATITIRDASGVAVGSTVADGAGNWSIAAGAISAPLNGFSGSIQAQDPAGNVAAGPVGPIDASLNVTLAVAPVTADDVVNIAEAASGSVPVSGTAAGEFRAGDTITVTLSSGVSQSTTLAANGSWTVNFTGAQLAAATSLTASIQTSDAAGNTATVAVQHLYGVDVVAPSAPVLTATGVTGVSGLGEVGATIQLRDASGAPLVGSSGQPVTAVVGANGAWTIPAGAFPTGAVPADFTGQVTAVDAAGNVSVATTIPAIDVTPPGPGTTTVVIDVIAGDDIVNLAESQGSVTLTGRVTGEFRAGDPVTVTAGSSSFSGVVGADGRWSIAAPGSALVGGTLLASVQASDAAGNVGTVTATRAYALDIQGPGGVSGLEAPGLTIAAAADGLISPTELSGGVSAVVALTPSTQAGDTVTLTLSVGGVAQTLSAVVDATALAAGRVTFAITPGLSDGQYTASAIIRDPSGNVSAPSTTLNFLVDAVPISLGSVTATASEVALGQAITGTVPISGATGTVSVSLSAPTGTFTSRGQVVTWAVDGSGALIGSAGGQTVVRAVINASGQYSISLLGPLDHPAAGADTLQLPIGVSVTDADGTAAGVISLGVIDSVPVATAPTTLTPTQPGVLVGALVQTMGADGGFMSSVTIDGRTFAYNPAQGAVSASGTSSTILSYGVQNGVLTTTTVRGETISVDLATGRYEVQITGEPASIPAAVRPDVAVGGGAGLLGLLDANALGLIQLNQQQLFSASDANNDLTQVVVRYTALLSVGFKSLGYDSSLAAELGLRVVPVTTLGLPSTSQLTITALDGGVVDSLKVNELLGTLTIPGGLASLLSLNVAQSLSIQATDSTGLVAIDTESNLADLALAPNLLSATLPAQITLGTSAGNVIGASDVGVGTQLDNRLYGYGGDDTLSGGRGNDILRGGSGNDTLNGGADNDLLIGGTGNDTMTGGSGLDVFRWERGDQGTIAQPAADIVTDFSIARVGLGGDVLDLSGLLIGEGRIGDNAGNLANYLHFERVGSGTLIHVSTTGGFVGGYGSATSTGGGGDQTILLANVDLTSGFGSDQAIIASLLARGNLVVDTLSANGSTAPANLVIGGTATDRDGDTASTTLTINTSQVNDPAVPGNVAPVVEANAQTVLGLLGVAAAGLDLNNQDLLAADANNNLSRVEVEYAPLLALNLTPLTFGYSASLAASYGLRVQVTASSGLLGVVAPTARIAITALDGGVIDNVQINRFLQTVHLEDSGGALLSSSLLSAGVLNALTITATDNQGLSGSATIGSVLNVNALHSLNSDATSQSALAALFAGDPDAGAVSSAGLEDHSADKTAHVGSDERLVLPAEPTDHSVHAKGADDMLVLPARPDALAPDQAIRVDLYDSVFRDAVTGEPTNAQIWGEDAASKGSDGRLVLPTADEDPVFTADWENNPVICLDVEAAQLAPDDGSAFKAATAIDLIDALLDAPDPAIDHAASFDTLNQPLRGAEAAGFDVYVAATPLFEDGGVVAHP